MQQKTAYQRPFSKKLKWILQNRSGRMRSKVKYIRTGTTVTLAT